MKMCADSYVFVRQGLVTLITRQTDRYFFLNAVKKSEEGYLLQTYVNWK